MAAKAGMCCVHAEHMDEFTVECDEEIAEIVKETAELAIAKAGRFYKIKCPHIGDGKVGINWFDIH